jgi:hypothetical protein
LAQKLQEAEEETVKPVLPWASNMSSDEQVNCKYQHDNVFAFSST